VNGVNHKGNPKEIKAELNIPKTILDNIDIFKSKNPKFSFFKNLFQVGNCCYFLL
jgi:hypothetical protein